jgi:EAL domain-containing protein (putative c-di-GMP-specific phosphodiesterase class I)
VSGVLHIWPASAHTLGKINQCGTVLDNQGSEYVTLQLDEGDMAAVVKAMRAKLSSEELRQSKSILLAEGRIPSLNDIPHIKPLDELLTSSESEWLCELLRERRLTSFLQPIVHANASSSAFGHEALLRAWDDNEQLVNPARLFQAAINGGLLFQLDRAARESAVRIASEHKLQTHLFINFTPTSIYDPENCLRATLKIIDEFDFDRSKVVFEVIETEKIDDVAHLTNVLDYYRRNGFKVALDDLGGGYSALSLLPELKPDFVKIDRALITDIHKSETQAVICKRIIDLCHELETRVVAEGIETADEEAVLLDLNVDYMQGYYYGRPQPHPLGWTKDQPETDMSSDGQMDPAIAQALQEAGSNNAARPPNVTP